MFAGGDAREHEHAADPGADCAEDVRLQPVTDRGGRGEVRAEARDRQLVHKRLWLAHDDRRDAGRRLEGRQNRAIPVCDPALGGEGDVRVSADEFRPGPDVQRGSGELVPRQAAVHAADYEWRVHFVQVGQREALLGERLPQPVFSNRKHPRPVRRLSKIPVKGLPEIQGGRLRRG